MKPSFAARVRSIGARVGELFRRRRLRRELDEELRLHLDLEIEHRVARGMTPVEAKRTAYVEFGGLRRHVEDTMDARGFAMVDHTVRDLRFAIRRLRRTPVFTAGVVAALAIGVSAAVGIGAIVVQVLLKPLPYDHPETLARVLVRTPGLKTTSTESSEGLLVLFRERARSFSSLEFFYENDGVSVTDGDNPENVRAAMISIGALQAIGVKPAAGRWFGAEDVGTKSSPVMISYDLWIRRFGGDPNVSGRLIELNRNAQRIAGVMPRGFAFPSASVGVWYPDSVNPTRAGLNFRYLNLIGRLKTGVTTRAAETELSGIAARIPERFPDVSAQDLRASGLTISVETLRDVTVAPVRAELTLLAIMVAVVLLVASSNVVTLFLLRAERLGGEVALSRALGASQAAVVRRFVAEGLAIAGASAFVAWPLVSLTLESRLGLSLAQLPRATEVTFSPAVRVVLVGATMALGVVLGVAGAARAGHGQISGRLRGAAQGTRAHGWRWAQRTLVAAQVASAMALLFASGLIGQSLWRLAHVDIGFAPRPAIVVNVRLPFRPYPEFENAAAFDLALIKSLRTIPGVQNATAAMVLPFDLEDPSLRRRIVTEREATPLEATARANVVPPNYFQAMGIPVQAGRSFAAGDRTADTPAVIISASLARELFGTVDCAGRLIRVPDTSNYPAFRVVGVVGDVFGERIEDGIMPTVYFPLLADVSPAAAGRAEAASTRREPYVPSGMLFIVYTDVPAASILPAIRKMVGAIDPKVPVSGASSLIEIASNATAKTRLMMILLTIAAVATLFLSAVGVYSVIAYAVAGRGREFGIRMALGATPGNVVTGVLRDSAILVGAGLVAGVVISVAGSALIRTVLFEVSPANPQAYAAAVLVIVTVSTAAAYFPARTAGRTDPTIALRSE